LWENLLKIISLKKVYIYCSGESLKIWDYLKLNSIVSPCKPMLIVQRSFTIDNIKELDEKCTPSISTLFHKKHLISYLYYTIHKYSGGIPFLVCETLKWLRLNIKSVVNIKNEEQIEELIKEIPNGTGNEAENIKRNVCCQLDYREFPIFRFVEGEKILLIGF
jgi:hypothetical protein